MDVHPRLAAPRAQRGAILTESDHTARIFQQALEVAPESRAAFLDKACDSDAERRSEVESLLRHHESGTIAGMLLAGRPAERSPSRGWTASVTLVAAVVSKLVRGRRRQVVAAVLAALFLGGIGYWIRDRIQRSLRAQIREQLRVVLTADVTALETWIQLRKREAGILAGNPAVRNLAERLFRTAGEDPANARKLKDSPLQKEFKDVIRPLLAEMVSSPQDAAVGLIDRTGLRLAATSPYEFTIGYQNNERAAAALLPVLQGQIKFLQPSRTGAWSRDRATEPRPVFVSVAPVRNAEGKVFALLPLVYLVDSGYSRILTVARMGETGETYAISPEGLMLSPSRFDGMLKKDGLLPVQPEATSMLTLQVRDPGGDVTRGYQPTTELEARPLTMIARVALASRGKTAEKQVGVILEPYRDYRGIEAVGAWRWLPEHDFAVVTEVDADEAFAVLGYVGRAFEVLFTLLGMFVALTLVASVALARMRAHEIRLGTYTLQHLIGQGGMGKVYMARHALLRRPTAVKVLTVPDGPSHELVRRFEREVQAVCRLTHPNTIQIYDFGRTPEGTFYYAMEYLPGITLAKLVSIKGPVAPGRVVHILKQVCGSLREAHQQGRCTATLSLSISCCANVAGSMTS